MKRPTKWYLLREQSREDPGSDDTWVDLLRIHPDGEVEFGQCGKGQLRPTPVDKGSPEFIAGYLSENGYTPADLDDLVKAAPKFSASQAALRRLEN